MRRKKAPDAPLPVASVDTDDRVKVVERREYVQRITQAPPSDKPPIEILAAPVEEEGDDLLDFLAELEEEIGLSLRVDRLPQFSANGKWNKGAAFEFCDNIPINKSDLKSGQYMAVIRDLYGPAAYRCTLREVGAGIIRSWPIKIAAPMQQAPQPRQPGSSVIYQQATPAEPQVQRDTLKELIDSAKQLNELGKVLGWQREPQQPAPVVQATPVLEREPLQDRIVSAALDAVLKTDKPETAVEILKNYLAPQAEFSWKEIIGEVIKPMVPMFMGLMAAYAQRQAPMPIQGQPMPQQPPQPALSPGMQPQGPPMTEAQLSYWQQVQAGTPPMQPALEVPQNAPVYDTFQPGSISPAPMPPQSAFAASSDGVRFPANSIMQPEQEDEDTMAENDLIESLVDMLDDCVRRMVSDPKVIEVGRAKIAEFKRNYPQLDAFIGMLVTMPPQAVLGFLAMQYRELAPLVSNPIAIQVITDLQTAIKPEQPV